MAEVLSEQDVREQLKELSGWSLEQGEIISTRQFETFPEAVDFVRRVAEAAEEDQHHPDIDIRYTKVRLALVSHDAGGITSKDIRMARRINAL